MLSKVHRPFPPMVCVTQTARTRELRAHEPKQLRCGVPWASLVCMSQVSGSRKSTIFNDLVHSALRHKLRWKALFPAGVKDEKGSRRSTENRDQAIGHLAEYSLQSGDMYRVL